MIVASAICVGILIFFCSRSIIRRHEEKFRHIETERMEAIRYGLAQEFFFVTPTKLRWAIRFIALVGSVVSALHFSPIPFVASLGAAWFLPAIILQLVQRRRRKLFEQQLGNALPQISSVLHAGHTFERAIESLATNQPAPLKQEFELLLKELRLGTPIDEALENLGQRFPSRDLEIVIRAISISRKVGSNLAEAFDRVSEMIRTRAALKNRLRSLTAQGRVQAWIAICMPFALTGLLSVISPGYTAPLFYTVTGKFLVGGSLLFLTIGGLWIHRIGNMQLVR